MAALAYSAGGSRRFAWIYTAPGTPDPLKFRLELPQGGGKLEADGHSARDVERLLGAAEELHQRLITEHNAGAT
ncbi:hypothetical protein ACIHCX_37850, partial [Streptomyces sp. NPDC052043]|uniref:hypothetical protein n=1 Tax=Streptomyces sp. NPDC052043 TaxID=3365684 RepID=UPI0037D08D62